MPERYKDRPEPQLGRKLYDKRFETYRENTLKVEECFRRYGVRRLQGNAGEELRRRAVTAIVEMQELMGADRLPVSDHFAVIPNYYGTYVPAGEDEDDEIVYSRTEEVMMYRPTPNRAGTMRYVVALEVVIRDFRNYEAMYEPLAQGNLRHLRHPCNTPLPPVVPSEKARVFDIPLGYITSFAYCTWNNHLEMAVVGQYKERIKLDIEINTDPTAAKNASEILRNTFEDDIGKL